VWGCTWGGCESWAASPATTFPAISSSLLCGSSNTPCCRASANDESTMLRTVSKREWEDKGYPLVKGLGKRGGGEWAAVCLEH